MYWFNIRLYIEKEFSCYGKSGLFIEQRCKEFTPLYILVYTIISYLDNQIIVCLEYQHFCC